MERLFQNKIVYRLATLEYLTPILFWYKLEKQKAALTCGQNWDSFIDGTAANDREIYSRIRGLLPFLTIRRKKSQVFDCLFLCL